MTRATAHPTGGRYSRLLVASALAGAMVVMVGCAERAPTVVSPTPSAPSPRADIDGVDRTAREPRVARLPELAAPLSRARVPVTGTELSSRTERSMAGQARGSTPRRVEIAGIDISLPIVPVGVTKDGTMELPSTVGQVGWYSFGVRPADSRGTTVLASHVDTRTEGLGPFALLREVGIGSTVTVTERSGARHRYRVTAVRKVPKSRLPLDRVFARAGPARLAVLTCGGAYDQGSGYRDNVLVLAEKST